MNIPKMNIDQFLFICGISYTEEQITKLQNLVDNFIQKILEIKREPQNYNDFLEAERREDAEDENCDTPNYNAFLNVETELEHGDDEKNDAEIVKYEVSLQASRIIKKPLFML